MATRYFKLLSAVVILLLGIDLSNAQMAANFTFKDVNGQTHRLYEDYLDQGKIVVAKVFFVDCPPCNSAAPGYQAKYVTYGSGSNDVQFIELSNKITDTNAKVNTYKNRHGITFPIAGNEGQSVQAQATFTGGAYGGFYGTPHYSIFAPDKKIYYDVSFNQIDNVINEIRNNSTAPGKPVTITTNLGQSLPSGIQVFMKPMNSNSPVLNITQLTNGTHQFEYPSSNFPEITDPVLYIESTATANPNMVLRASDVIALRKHILGLEPFANNKQVVIADVNGDGVIRSGDVIDLRKVILGLEQNFNLPTYFLYPSQQVTLPTSGNNINVSLEILIRGNVVD